MEKLKEQVYDELLVLRCQDGESPAFDELFRRWQKRLWRHACYLTGNDEVARDMTQETWMAVVRGIRRLDDPATFKTWLYRIMVHKCADWIRQKQRGRQLSENLKDETRIEQSSRDENQSEALAIRMAVAALPYNSKLVLTLHYQQDLTVTEIAEILGVPIGTVKSRLYHARENLREKLETKQ